MTRGVSGECSIDSPHPSPTPHTYTTRPRPRFATSKYDISNFKFRSMTGVATHTEVGESIITAEGRAPFHLLSHHDMVIAECAATKWPREHQIAIHVYIYIYAFNNSQNARFPIIFEVQFEFDETAVGCCRACHILLAVINFRKQESQADVYI